MLRRRPRDRTFVAVRHNKRSQRPGCDRTGREQPRRDPPQSRFSEHSSAASTLLLRGMPLRTRPSTASRVPTVRSEVCLTAVVQVGRSYLLQRVRPPAAVICRIGIQRDHNRLSTANAHVSRNAGEPGLSKRGLTGSRLGRLQNQDLGGRRSSLRRRQHMSPLHASASQGTPLGPELPPPSLCAAVL